MTEPETDSLPREDVTTGTICEYQRDDALPWVIVVREPKSISEYAADLDDRTIPYGWKAFDAETTDVIHFVPLDGKDDVITRLEDSGLDGHREVADDLLNRADCRPLVGALPHFDVLGPTKHATAGDSPDSGPEERHVE